MIKLIKWLLAPSKKPTLETNDLYSKLNQLEARVEVLEEENVGLTNELYRVENSLDARIDILTGEKWMNRDV